MSILSRDIRDQSRKLSEIAPNFGSFFALPNFVGAPFQNLYTRYHACLGVRPLVKFREFTPTTHKFIKVIGTHMLNKPIS